MAKKLFFLSILLGFAVSLAIPAAAAPSRAASPVPKVNWTACYREFGYPFECGIVQVPLDYSDPNGATISIALIRLPAGDPANKIGSIFFNPGGPGGSGVDFVLYAGPYLYTEELRQKFDLVGFDPRGIARSTALRCFGNPKQWAGYFTPFAFPITLEQADAWEAADRYLDDACAQRGFKIIDHMSTADTARDLDLLRQAVGDEMLTYAGYSYGTFLGVTYANLFPDKVRALVVDGVLDPIAWTTGNAGEGDTIPFSTRLRSDQGALATLNEFFRLCDENPATCAFSGAAAARYDRLATRLRNAPIEIILPDGTPYTFTYQDLISNSLGAMYNSFSWPDFAVFLAYIESQVPPEELGAQLYAVWDDLGFINKRGFPHYPNYVEGFPGVACSDSDNPDNYPAWWNNAQQAEADYGYFGPIWTYVSSICAAWPGKQIGRYTGPFTAETANPVLVVGNFFDPATRYQGAQTVAGLLPNSRLISLNGWGHVSIFMSQCMDQAVAAYLVDKTLPAEGTVCNQDLTPFLDFGPSYQLKGAAATRASLIPVIVPDAVRKGTPNGK
ncbi:MAG: alpha/beta hydrolase [Omnitrophica WOR_2 bacterium]